MGLARARHGHRTPDAGAGLVHHEHRAVQYAVHRYRTRLLEHGVICSTSRKAHCWENVLRESFFATRKRELLLGANCRTREAARVQVFQNRRGLLHATQAALCAGYLTLAQMHAAAD